MAYWDHVTRLVETTMDTRTDIGNAAKADLLRDELAKINTTDEFYVIVYNDCTGWDKHAFHYMTAKTLVRFRRGMCNVVVYASSTAHDLNQKDYDWLKDKVNGMKGLQIVGGSMRERAERIFKDFDYRGCGLVGLIRIQHNPEIRSTGRWTWGPGWWVRSSSEAALWDFSGTTPAVIIVGHM